MIVGKKLGEERRKVILSQPFNLSTNSQCILLYVIYGLGVGRHNREGEGSRDLVSCKVCPWTDLVSLSTRQGKTKPWRFPTHCHSALGYP